MAVEQEGAQAWERRSLRLPGGFNPRDDAMKGKAPKAARQRVTVELKRQRPLLVIRASVNGQRPTDFVIDTGASGTVITPELAEEVGARLHKKQATAVGASGQQTVSFARLKSLRVEAIEISNLQVTVMSLAALNQATRLRLAGIIGYDVLRRFKVTIDYPNGLLVFESGGASKPRAKQAALSRRAGAKLTR